MSPIDIFAGPLALPSATVFTMPAMPWCPIAMWCATTPTGHFSAAVTFFQSASEIPSIACVASAAFASNVFANASLLPAMTSSLPFCRVLRPGLGRDSRTADDRTPDAEETRPARWSDGARAVRALARESLGRKGKTGAIDPDERCGFAGVEAGVAGQPLRIGDGERARDRIDVDARQQRLESRTHWTWGAPTWPPTPPSARPRPGKAVARLDPRPRVSAVRARSSSS